MLADVEHVPVDYDRGRFAAHVRQGGVFRYGDGELAVIYNRAPCRYREPLDVRHGHPGYRTRAQIILARSGDGGRTWDRANDVVVFDETRPVEERRAFVGQCLANPRLRRARIDLAAPDAAVYFGRTWAGEGDPPGLLCFALRSADRGRTWEDIPTPVLPPTSRGPVHKDGHPLVRLADGTYLGAMTHANAVWLYGSDDDGLSWEPLAQVCSDPTGLGACTYAGLIPLPSGRLQCYTLNIGGVRDAIQMCHSDDGATWSDEQVLRADASTLDLGYPVAVETAPGRVFTAYYYTLGDGNGFGGTRFIAGTHFRLT